MARATASVSYLDTLNPEQRRAVEHGVSLDGHVGAPLLVIAGAGSGKTNTLAHRVAHLIVSGADPRRILLMTFSRRAAAEMAKRVERIARKVLGENAGAMTDALTWDAIRRLEEADPIPEWLGSIIEKVEAFGGPGTRIGQVLCTEYDVGVGIGWHREKPHFDRVFGLSLGSACQFRFRRAAYTKWERFTLEARPRSIYMMSGPSREVWEHSIPAVEAQRYSITFRTIAAKS
jgi:alkylated DNA repair dioxygenase AlkB